MCITYQFLGTDGEPVAVASCESYESCCYGTCCDVGEACVAQRAGNFAYDGEVYSVERVERNGWKLPDGSAFKNVPHVCVSDLSQVEGSKIVLIPLIGMAVVAGSAFVAFKKRQRPGILSFVPSLLIFVSAFFLQFSATWPVDGDEMFFVYSIRACCSCMCAVICRC